MPLRVKRKTRWYYRELYVVLGYVTSELSRKERKLVGELRRENLRQNQFGVSVFAKRNNKGKSPEELGRDRTATEQSMWAEKRARQAVDIARLESHELDIDDVSWFAGGVARSAKIRGDLV